MQVGILEVHLACIVQSLDVLAEGLEVAEKLLMYVSVPLKKKIKGGLAWFLLAEKTCCQLWIASDQ